MSYSDLKNSIQLATSGIFTLSGTTPAKGNIVDRTGFGNVTYTLITATVTDAGTADGFSTEIQHSDTTADTDFTAVASSDLIGLESALKVTLDTADSIPIGSIGYKGLKRYVRAVTTGTTGTNAVIAGQWIKSAPDLQAVTPVIAPNIAAT